METYIWQRPQWPILTWGDVRTAVPLAAVETLRQALNLSLEKTERVVRKKHFWDALAATALNDRQRKVINMLLDGFDGKLTSSKWYKICHCSQDTALGLLILGLGADVVQDLVYRLGHSGGGMSVYLQR